MESYKIENLTFKYPSADEYAISDISLEILSGEFVTVCGPSGCGKSTLLRLLKSAISPHGEKTGKILFGGLDLSQIDFRSQTAQIGFVMQSPENQIVTDKVWHELAFGLESLGVGNSEIRARVAEMASFFGMEEWFHKKTTELSGGQKQLLNLASVMVMQPSVLILDEPTSQLDPIAAKEFLEAIAKINRELGVTVILSEHRLEEVLSFTDKMVIMEKGSIVYCGKPQIAAQKLAGCPMLKAMPAAMRVFAALDKGEINPVTVREGRTFLNEYKKRNPFKPIVKNENAQRQETAIELKDIWFRYEKNSADVLKSLSTKVCRGEVFAILGGNGSGKTTALSMICGLNKPYRGEVKIANEDAVIALLPQNPQTLFVEKTVEKDILEMLSENEDKKLFEEVVALCELGNLLNRHPYDLSGGEMQRLALAKVLMRKPDILLLDEPTKGMDAHFKEKLARIIKDLQKNSVTVIMVSHDIEFCCKYADRCAMLFDGEVVSEDAPKTFFSGKSFYTTAANKMARGIIDGAVTTEDIIESFGVKIPKQENDENHRPHIKNDVQPNKQNMKPLTGERRAKISKGQVTVLIISLFVMLITSLAGIYLLEDRKYYFISLFLIIEATVPFLFCFERRRPSAREITVISVLCALAVAGRIAFFMLPQFKPIAAIIIITGAVFGAEAGFLTGAVSAFVSNFYFGQGPWTPWQVFGFATIGLLAGIIFHKEMLPKKKGFLCVFGMLSVILLYGPIADLSALSHISTPTWSYILTTWLLGLPMSTVFGASTALFLFIGAKPLIEKLERIKQKYGLL